MANEISSMTLANSLPSRPATEKSQFTKLSDVSAAQTGKPLPAEGKALPQQQPANQVQLKEAVDQINQYVQTVQRDLSFSMDGETGHTVIKVMDSGSGELIRQIPAEEVLALATYLVNENQESAGSGALPQGMLFSDRT